ncbi:SDR family oxidoreductase [Micromonospora musae]|uniref:SDR family oxidoreductase n=1 Tax=Micromonospora musae TaxID=1894970 RepID=A0A3A9YE82_9ACTN|nr:SDR family oxidoreductase [Micromonospora musae]RKN15012.1 SDR family oxidoreductase [Micromonospora musae]RKN35540.1 SDR family oxidoreductase [Micromonospora musae]
MSKAQRVAIVTGGSRGIGRQVVLELAEEGYALVVNYAGNKADADETMAALAATGAKAIAFQADVADENAVNAMFDAAEREFGGVDVVVNMAGIMPVTPLVELDLDTLDRVIRTNLRGALLVTQQAALRVRPGGAIINTSSSITKFSRPGYTAYAATKGGVEAITLILARELRGRDITVNTVAPGPIDTELFLRGKDEETIARIAAEPPLGRMGTPEDIAPIVAFLAGPGRWINGQVVYANGGAV